MLLSTTRRVMKSLDIASPFDNEPIVRAVVLATTVTRTFYAITTVSAMLISEIAMHNVCLHFAARCCR